LAKAFRTEEFGFDKGDTEGFKLWAESCRNQMAVFLWKTFMKILSKSLPLKRNVDTNQFTENISMVADTSMPLAKIFQNYRRYY
jgi:hypothetical protein